MTREAIDWSQLWYPGPTRVFTPEELARAGQDPPSRTALVMITLNVLLLCSTALQFMPPALVAKATGYIVALLVPAAVAARALWRKPSRWRLMQYSLLYVCMAFAFGAVEGFVQALGGKSPEQIRQLRPLIQMAGVIGIVLIAALWMLTVYRSHQIAARLRELDERDRAVDMARQLAAAQIQPHFLFNSLAALQHWVATKDDRAAPLLGSLTGYLRAVLPMFQRHSLTLDEELQAVRSYLEVMRARLGPKLQLQWQVDEAALGAPLPPGLLLTLVENAIEHGVVPALGEVQLCLNARRQGQTAHIELDDTGPGLPPGFGPAQEGVGLANSRQRLAQMHGGRATLTLQPRPGGGTQVRLDLPATAHGSPTLPNRP
jgi:signal transduction histidine kinase